ncbi:efflux RND transporter periplasmic adaptor subunit [Uliginosibacterium sp. H1]|uniref:efflux RND transporter periplasmic adaptor subunit n=1 Tax=Uliginosibacterium sp. H1 TaxID=3114757 RepID=UPI002E1739E6|nr:efflux RND transporter periplasmic adaptor subunit [Uliginosibacterium sp. H1]
MNTTPTPSRRKRRLVFHPAVIAALVLVLAAGGYWGWKKFANKKTPQDEFVIVAVQRGDLEDSVTATGTLQPKNYVDVGAQVSGQLKKFHVEIGSQVEVGDLLAEIDPTVYRAKVDASRAQLKNQQAQLEERRAKLSLAELQYKRQQNLIQAEATTTESVQQAEAELRSARAQLESLRAQIEQTESNLRSDEANLNYAQIYAPIAGTVVSITARQGATLNANQSAPVILRIADLNTMTVQTQVSEADVNRLRNGMQAYFTTLGNPQRRFYGTLTKVEPTPTVTNNVVLYNALFDVPNPNQALMTQMTAQVYFVVASARDALLIPTGAIKTVPRRRQGADSHAEQSAPASEQSAATPRSAEAVARNTGADNAPRKNEGSAAANAERPRTARDEQAGGPGRERIAGANTPTTASEENGSGEERPRRRIRDGQSAPEGTPGSGERMSREPRGDLTPEEMQARRAAWQQRMAERGREGEGNAAGATTGERPAPARTAQAGARNGEPRQGDSTAPARRRNATNANAGGAPGSAMPEQPRIRKATVRVIDEATGKIEDREVTIGATNRIQAVVLSGLQEGEKVIAGKRADPAANRGGQQGQGQQGGQNRPSGPPMGMPRL